MGNTTGANEKDEQGVTLYEKYSGNVDGICGGSRIPRHLAVAGLGGAAGAGIAHLAGANVVGGGLVGAGVTAVAHGAADWAFGSGDGYYAAKASRQLSGAMKTIASAPSVPAGEGRKLKDLADELSMM